MATAYTSLLGLALPVTGELQGTWGTTVNDSITSLLDTAVAGTTTLSSDADVTLSTTTGAANQARQAILLCSGARTALRTITAPAQSKIYTVINATTGGFSVKLVGVGPTTGVTVVAGESALVAWNGSDFIKISNTGGAGSFTSLTATGAVTFSTATDNLALGTSQTSGTWTAGGAAQTGALTLDQSTKTHTLNLGTGATESAATKTVNIGTAGVSGSTTAVNIGSAVSGATNNVTINGNPTFNSGTANGVLYLNGSKVATSGSALVFDGTRLLVQTTSSNISSSERLTVNGLATTSTSSTTVPAIYAQNSDTTASTNQPYIYLHDGVASRAGLGVNYTDSALVLNGFGGIYFRYGGNGMGTTEGMRLTSTGLGIGTSSPGTLLHGSSGRSILTWNSTTTNNDAMIALTNSTDNSRAEILANKDGTGGATYLSFGTRNTSGSTIERARIDSSGNLGLGVTPSAWGGVLSKALEFNNGCYVTAYNTSGTDSIYVGANNYYNGSNYIYKNSRAASQYQQTGGAHYWYTAPSGTAGNAITFTQAMTLDASGNLGVGRTSMVASSASSTIEASGALVAGGPISAHQTNRGIFQYTSNETTIRSYGATAGTGAIVFNTGGGGGSADTERARITSGGDFAIGTTTATNTLTVQGSVAYNLNGTTDVFKFYTGGAGLIYAGTTTSTAIGFITSGGERARITSGGDLLVGTTNAAVNVGVGVKTIASGSVFAVGATGDYFSGYNSSASAFRFYVSIAGTISATNTTISAISDQRLKENIRDIDVGLDKIMALKPRKFDWKAGKGQDKKDVRGFIAQEFEQVFPDLIDEWKDPAPEGEEPYKAVRADLIPVLVKAIQELKAELDATKARLAALEAK